MGELATAVDSYRRWLEEDQNRGEVTLSASCEWLGGTQVDVEVGRRTLKVDEPKSLGGGGTAPNPVGYLMTAIGSCTAIGLSYWSDILEIPFDSAQVLVEGDIALGAAYGVGDDVSPSFSEVRLEIRVGGPESMDRYEELVATANAHSPLLETLARPIPVSTKVSSVNTLGSTNS